MRDEKAKRSSSSTEHGKLPDAAYVVLESPDPCASEITSLRWHFDPERTALPAEITLIGSSGVGRLQAEQDQTKVCTTLEDIARMASPFTTHFTELKCFPGTQIYWLQPASSQPFVALHERIKESGLVFEDIGFPYTPHCTIADLGEAEQADIDAIRKISVPEQEFTVDTMSVYYFEDEQCRLLWQTCLGTKE